MQSSGLGFQLAARKGGHSMARFSTLANCRFSFRLFLAAALTVYTVLENASVTQAASAAPTRVVIGYPSPGPRVAPLWIAQDLDFFAKYGLTAQVVLVRNNQMLTAGLAAGDIADVIKEFDPKPYPSIDGLRNMQRLLALQNPRLVDIDAANLLDTTFMRKLEDSGFMAQLQACYPE